MAAHLSAVNQHKFVKGQGPRFRSPLISTRMSLYHCEREAAYLGSFAARCLSEQGIMRYFTCSFPFVAVCLHCPGGCARGPACWIRGKLLREVVTLQELIDIFNDHELELMISGLPEIDIDDLRANTEYSGYTAASRQIQWCVLLQARCAIPLVAVCGRNISGTPQLLWPDSKAGSCTLKLCLLGTFKWSHVFCIVGCDPAVCTILRLHYDVTLHVCHTGLGAMPDRATFLPCRFWELVRDLDKEDLALLVQFVTGTSKVPLEGFKALQVGTHRPRRLSLFSSLLAMHCMPL